jgi:endoglucanase
VPSLSGQLPPLRVSENRIVNANTGEPLRLRGVNRSGLEYSSSLSTAGITGEELDQIVMHWGANVIRVPFNQQWALSSAAYRAELDLLIAEAAQRGAYVLLDLQWIDAQTERGKNSDGTSNFVPPLPDVDSIALWRELARSYRDEAAVLYDIFNEPHDPLPDDTVPFLGINESGQTFPLRKRVVTMKEWQPWAIQLVSAIRAEHPEALVFVPGVNWAYDLGGFPLPGIDNVVYSTHVYPNKGDNWDAAFGDLSSRYPVFLGEFGGAEGDLQWGQSLLKYLDGRSLGWAAWSWADHPHLVGANFEPTPFGSLVQSALQEA